MICHTWSRAHFSAFVSPLCFVVIFFLPIIRCRNKKIKFYEYIYVEKWNKCSPLSCSSLIDHLGAPLWRKCNVVNLSLTVHCVKFTIPYCEKQIFHPQLCLVYRFIIQIKNQNICKHTEREHLWLRCNLRRTFVSIFQKGRLILSQSTFSPAHGAKLNTLGL